MAQDRLANQRHKARFTAWFRSVLISTSKMGMQNCIMMYYGTLQRIILDALKALEPATCIVVTSVEHIELELCRESQSPKASMIGPCSVDLFCKHQQHININLN